MPKTENHPPTGEIHGSIPEIHPLDIKNHPSEIEIRGPKIENHPSDLKNHASMHENQSSMYKISQLTLTKAQPSVETAGSKTRLRNFMG